MRTAADYVTPRRPRGRAYLHPDLVDSLTSNGQPALPTGTEHIYDAVLADLLARRAPRKGRR